MLKPEQTYQPISPEQEALYRVYEKLQNEITHWQEERGPDWAPYFVPDKTVPYFPLSRLPEAPVLELTERLLAGSKRLWTNAELQTAWSQYRCGQGPEDEELMSRLILAVQGILGLARQCLPAALRQPAANISTPTCPVCGQEPGLSLLVPPVGKRVLHCTGCGHEWPGKRVGCIHCGSEEAREQTYLHDAHFPGIELVVCQSCGGDFKEVDLRERPVKDLVWEDIRTLPLNVAAEKWLQEQALKK